MGESILLQIRSTCLSTSSNTSIESSKWNTFFMFNDILQILLGTSQSHSSQGHCSFPGILKENNNRNIRLVDAYLTMQPI